MARSKPMTIGLLGTGKTSVKNAAALIGDLVTDAGEVTLVVALTKTHWTSDIEAIVEWAHDQGYKYDAVLDDSSAGEKDLADYIEAAEQTYKVAKPAVKVVNLLERADDGRLLMLWDDEDDECMTALERAVDRSVPALDLTNGLDVLQFDDPAAAGGDDVAPESRPEAPSDDDQLAAAAEDDDDPAAPYKPADDLDSLGVRKLRDMVEDELGLTRRKVGQMSKDDCIDALRKQRAGGSAAPTDSDDQEEGDEAQQTTRPAAASPSREEDEEDAADLSDIPGPVLENTFAKMGAATAAPVQDHYLRQMALDFATKAEDKTAEGTVKRAEAYLEFLQG